MDPTQLYLDTHTKAVQPDGSLNPVFWRYLTDLQQSLTTIDLTTQVTGILQIGNGGTASGTGPQASTITGATLASNVHASSLTSVGILTALAVSGIINGMSDLYTQDWTDYSATSTIVGWASFTTKKLFYKTLGKLNYIAVDIAGVSNATSITFTLPNTAANSGVSFDGALGLSIDNGVTLTNPGRYNLPFNTATVACFSNMSSAAGWTNVGTKQVRGQFWYEGA